MPKRDSLVLLNDICTALGRISSYVQGMDKDSFLNDQKTIDAVTRNLEIVGEAAFQMDEVIKNRFPATHGRGAVGEELTTDFSDGHG